MTPIRVIGINVALADDITAGYALDEAIKEEDYSREKLAPIEQERKPETDKLQELHPSGVSHY